MQMVPFYTEFPDLAFKEMGSITVYGRNDLPDGQYGFLESYCDKLGCDCRRVLINVVSPTTKNKILATINYGWKSAKFYTKWMGDKEYTEELKGPTLDPLNQQTDLAPALLDLFKLALKDQNYVARLARHYKMFKQAIEEKHRSRGKLKEEFGKKVGRNDLCPCGSGKKFKKCCLNKLIDGDSKYQVMRAVHWDMAEVRALSTEQIIQKLRDFGVDFRKKQFLKDIKKFYSACDLAYHWEEIYSITAEGLDEDFIWMAAIVLWERLVPDVINSERLDSMMQKGYDLLEEEKETEACTLWLEVWEHLKGRFSLDMKSINDAERVFSGMQSLYNWCQDLETELWNAGTKETSFYEKRIKYCQEFCTLFPETDTLIIKNMKRAVAESYFAIGMSGQGEGAFKALIEEFPDSSWGYIGWGDMYWLIRMNDKIPLDYEKAERIYRMALDRNVDDKEGVLDRLKELEKERGKRNKSKS